jgi:cell division transport system permease protein
LQIPARDDVDRVVPRSGLTAQLTVFVAGAMAFLCVFALALLFTSNRLADRWASELARTATVRVSATEDQQEAQVTRVLEILAQTPGIAAARALTQTETQALLEPWLGPALPLDQLSLPTLIEVTEDADGYDGESLRLRLQAETPGATLDDHTRWRRPLVAAADRVRLVGWLGIFLIAGALVAMMVLAASASLAANARVIEVLRLLGAKDSFVVRAFTRRFTLRALIGAAIGTLAGVMAVFVIPKPDATLNFFADLGFRGAEWLLLLAVPFFSAVLAFVTTRVVALRRLQETR